MSRRHLTTAIPYVNARPHLRFAMELVQADVTARHWRHRDTRSASPPTPTTIP
ncbi:methionyl-tRNA synthetase [Actinoalloteichus hoggarensis]|uniref:Methionyl-tRNA synthetase n=1 Tax=Actinoalloteichus hoggarensis TaxID=1470176 RepID=A0A221W5P1_9PSEU|nr:class I tRNA ligase family protein [Actinoalloteichus hoggarensis]ASO21158.1 methionyl-tRNA synthetase [Actinoalloteichus hoggarensis]MBB5921087.1 methionyl-tRNA synthetase [Actinoalloteichus hoggarensis]